MTVAQFLEWAMAQPKGRYELVDGQVVAMAPERALHVIVKVAVVRILQDAVAKAKLPCVVYGDGMTVAIDEHRAREPDAVVQCSRPFDPDALVADEPMIVVEVISPSSTRTDTVDKLAEYFTLATLKHYLVVNPVARTVIHHARVEDAEFRTRILKSGEIDISPPGFVISVEAIFESIPPEAG
ncbi:MAG: Uma2 family endonuclease [Propylenella sp.]